MRKPVVTATAVIFSIWLCIGCTEGQVPGSDAGRTDTSIGPDSVDVDSNLPADTSVSRDATDTNEPPLNSPGTCDSDAVRLLRVNPWPGKGIQLYVELSEMAAFPEGSVIKSKSGGTFPVQAVGVPQKAGLTGIVVIPAADATVNALHVQAAKSLVSAMPAGERTAVWVARAGKAPMLKSDLTDNRKHLLQRIEEVAVEDGAALSESDADSLRESIAEAEGRWGTIWKSLIIIGQTAQFRTAPDPSPAIAAYYLTSGETSSVPGAFAVDPSDVDGSVGALVSLIGTRRAGVFRAGSCPGAAENDELTLKIGEVTCTMSAPAHAEHLQDETCDEDAGAADEYPFGDTVDLVLTAEEKAIWDQRHASKSKDDFRLSVVIGAGTAIPASAHFRGQTSMACQRKNYDVNLDGGASRRLMPDGGGDEFYLVSMCKDVGFYNQLFANTILSEWGIFNLKFRVVRLRLNGENHGMYILVQEPGDTTVKRHAALSGVVRRPFDADVDVGPEVKFSGENDVAATLARYKSMVAVATDGNPDTMLSDFSRVLDLEYYLRWMGAMTFLHNGDYVDEIFFYGSIENEKDIWWRPLSWDSDDLFSSCHHGGKYALADDNGILYCAEAFMDQSLTRSTAVYAAWIDQLEWVLDTLDTEKARQVMDSVKAGLFAVLDDETAAALVEFTAAYPDAGTAEGAKARISSLMDDMLADVESSRAALKTKIAAYRNLK